MRPILITLLIASCGAFAQSRGGFASGAYASRAPARPGYAPAHPAAGRPHNAKTVIVPYPVFYGGYYLPPPAYGYGDPGSAYGNGYVDPSPSPAVMVNPGYRPDTPNPVLYDYSDTPLPEPTFKKYASPSHPYEDQAASQDQQPTIYLIAMKDHTIFPAVAYWVSGDTLNYVTTEGSLNRATLALVDRDFSAQLNAERHVDFHLPAQK